MWRRAGWETPRVDRRAHHVFEGGMNGTTALTSRQRRGNLSVNIEVLIYPPQADLVQHGMQPTAVGARVSRRG